MVWKKHTGRIRLHKLKKIHVNKPWFDKECAKSRTEYFRVKKRLKKTRSIEIQSELRNVSKAYQREIRSKSTKYYKSLNRKLRKLRSSNSKEFWDIINKECSDSTKDNNIALESFFEHFKNLSKNDNDIHEDNNNEFDPRTVTHGLNEEINNLFTSDEIMKQIKKKNNGKSPGCDNIVNEFVKHSLPMLIEVITSLFNVIRLSGKVPSSWSIGIIIPIYKKREVQMIRKIIGVYHFSVVLGSCLLRVLMHDCVDF